MTWHLDAETVARYEEGRADRVTAASLEAHLEGCADCRRLINYESNWLEESWEAVAAGVYVPDRSFIQSLLTRFGVPSHLARLVAATPSLRPAWLVAMAMALAFAGLAARFGSGEFDAFLMVAPVVPVIGVMFAYGRHGDSAYEVVISSSLDQVRLLLLRASAVTLATFVVAGLVDVVAGGRSGFGLWLLPSAALVLMSLALGARMSLLYGSLVSIGTWVVFVLVASVRPGATTVGVVGGGTQAWFVAVAVTAGVVLYKRVGQYREGGL